MGDIDMANEMLASEGLSLVIVKDSEVVYSTTGYGVKGLIEARGMRLVPTSALENQNVDKAFAEIVTEIRAKSD